MIDWFRSEYSSVGRGEGFWCTECGRSYSSSSNLARHKQSHRTLAQGRKCAHCAREYSSPAALAMHMRTHGAGCGCPYCGKSFSRPWLLQGHIRTHTGEKPFQCGVCRKSFADKSNLRAHTQTHSADKPFSCANCGKNFALKSYLSKHEESSCLRSKDGRRRRGGSVLSSDGGLTVSDKDGFAPEKIENLVSFPYFMPNSKFSPPHYSTSSLSVPTFQDPTRFSLKQESP